MQCNERVRDGRHGATWGASRLFVSLTEFNPGLLHPGRLDWKRWMSSRAAVLGDCRTWPYGGGRWLTPAKHAAALKGRRVEGIVGFRGLFGEQRRKVRRFCRARLRRPWS
jgi:hypothetical protein